MASGSIPKAAKAFAKIAWLPPEEKSQKLCRSANRSLEVDQFLDGATAVGAYDPYSANVNMENGRLIPLSCPSSERFSGDAS